MADINGVGVYIGKLVCTFTVCELCIATIKDIGGEFDRTGICGVEITITSDRVGSGAGTAELAAICTDSAFTAAGMGPGGTRCAATGTCIAVITTITVSTDALGGPGADSGALGSTCIGCELCIGITRDIGVEYVPIGTCGVVITTTGDLVGSGDVIAGLVDICTACGFCGASMEHDGTMSERIGICTVGITTITICTDGTSGPGVGIDALVFICIDCAHCTGTIRAIGVACVRTGICGDAIITTSAPVGSGPIPTAASGGTSIACGDTSDGQVPIGTMCAVTGLCIEKTHTIIGYMDEPTGSGAGSDESACTSIACAHCTAITRDIGAASVPIGTSTVAIIIISDHAGSGDATGRLGVIGTACGFTSDGMELAGTQSVHTGTCIGAITTTIIFTDATVGRGDDTVALACISTACEPCIATTKVIGDECAHIGTCGVATTTTDVLAGSGGDGVGLAATCTACAS